MWYLTSEKRPPKDSKVVWQNSVGEEIRGTYCGGIIWYPEGSSMYIYYTPIRWRLA